MSWLIQVPLPIWQTTTMPSAGHLLVDPVVPASSQGVPICILLTQHIPVHKHDGQLT